MSKEMDFFIYLLEAYAHAKGRPASDVFVEWSKQGFVEEIYGNYLIYHTEALENAIEDIDRMTGMVNL